MKKSLPVNFKHELLNDSKQLSEYKREILRPIIEKEALAYGISFVHHNEVDQLNVLQASIIGMQRSISNMKIVPEYIIVMVINLESISTFHTKL